MEREREKNSESTLNLLEELEGRIALEAQQEGSFRNFMITSGEFSQDNSRDLECLEYLIRCLEEKQIAESVAKILSTERSNG